MPEKQHPWARTGALFPLCYQAINPNLILKLIATETNYKQQDLKAPITVEVNKVRQHYHWGNTGGMRDLSTVDFLSQATI